VWRSSSTVEHDRKQEENNNSRRFAGKDGQTLVDAKRESLARVRK
jgi:hypothetical protein